MLVDMSFESDGRHIAVLSLNCQHGRQPSLRPFFEGIRKEKKYDFLLLQEVNRAVVDMLPDDADYSVLRFPSHLDDDSYGSVTVMYRSDYRPEGIEYFSFDKLLGRKFSTHYGLAVATFFGSKGQYTVGSLHMNAGLRWDPRKKEAYFLRELLQERSDLIDGSIILGGDFNNGYRWEDGVADRIFAPLLTNVTTSIDRTLDSLYSEPAGNFVNDVSWLLSHIGVHVTVKVDHIFFDSKLAGLKRSVRKLSDRVSDHSPVEVIVQLP